MASPVQPYQGSYLPLRFDKATVADAMSPGVVCCSPDVSAVDVARMMAAHRIHAVVVEGIELDAAHREAPVWGVVSDLDLARAAHSRIEELTAADLAATEPVAIDPSTPLGEAAQMMDEHATAHLIVVDDGQPTGMLSTLDIAGAIAWAGASSSDSR